MRTCKTKPLPYYSLNRGDKRLSIVYELLIAAIGVTAVNYFMFFYPKRKHRETLYHVKVKFAHGIITKLVLNAEQYEQLQATLNTSDGYFEIGDDKDNVKLYREFICAVEVKKR